METHRLIGLRALAESGGFPVLDAYDTALPCHRDLLARWLAERVGLDVGATAPVFARMVGVGAHPAWRLLVHGDTDYDRSPATGVTVFGFAEPGDFPHAPAETLRDVPGISALTDPAAALAAAVLAVAGGSRGE